MTDSDVFRRQYLGTWDSPSEDYRRAYILWCVVNTLIEQEDNKWCSAKLHGEAVPATPWEQTRVHENGRAKHRLLERLRPGFTAADWLGAKKAVGRLSDREQERVANDNPELMAELWRMLGPIPRNFE
jgi:hypothetical protein